MDAENASIIMQLKAEIKRLEARERELIMLLANADAGIERLSAELEKAKAYAAKNPLGGPATMFYAIGDRIKAGDPMKAVLDDYGLAFTDKQEALLGSERKP